jgi:hypothetical protein
VREAYFLWGAAPLIEVSDLMARMWLLPAAAALLVSSAALLWAAGALYFDVGGEGWLGKVLVGVWLFGAAIAWWAWPQSSLPAWLLGLTFVVLLGWWFSLRPSLHRAWAANFARLPEITVCGDALTIENLRDTVYHSEEEADVRFCRRTVCCSRLRGVDLAICYWGPTWICHPMLIFDFGSDGAVCFSIEIRYREGQHYRLLPSFYRQQELIYVVCDPRDAILKRVQSGVDEQCYLYRLQIGREASLELLWEYVEEVNSLVHKPRWYHGITANCTTSFYRQRKGAMGWDWRLLVNGLLDIALYEQGNLDQRLPFRELKRRSRINELARVVGREDFYAQLRTALDRQLAE